MAKHIEESILLQDDSLPDISGDDATIYDVHGQENG